MKPLSLIFTLLFSLSWLLSACGAPPAAIPPTSTPVPSPTSAPLPILPPPEDTAAQFLSAWQLGDYTTMYRLLSTQARQSISEADFVQAYQQAQNEASVLAIRTTPRSTLRRGAVANAAFHVEWDTPLVSTLRTDNTMTMTLAGDEWNVEWSSDLIWPGLTNGRQLRMTWSIPRRANLYDRDGLGLAVEGKRVIIGVIPGDIVDEVAMLAALSPVLGESPQAIQSRYAGAAAGWFVPVGDLSGDEAVAHYAVLNTLAGVGLREKIVRAYRPNGQAAHTIGYVGVIPPGWQESYKRRGYRGDEWVGLVGLEAWGEPILGGRRGGRLDMVTAQGELVTTLAQQAAVPARPVYASLKRAFQEQVEQILGQRTGVIIAMDPNNGQILAVASHPGFDPNEIVSPPAVESLYPITPTEKSYVNRAMLGLYHPGSTFKPIVMAAALESGLFTPQSSFECPGYWDGLGPGFRKKCWLEEGHGVIDLVSGLSASCNVTFYQIGYALNDHDETMIPEFARQFGLGRPTGIILEENSGLVPDMKWKNETLGQPWYAGDAVNLSIGQGDLTVTPLQIAVMYSAIANGGTLYKPQLVTRIGNQDVGPEEIIQAEVAGRLPVSPENLAAVQEGLRGVIAGARGTARNRYVGLPVAVAGKTGTAETATEQPDAWFAAYGPYDAPELTVVVLVENAGQGSAVAAPLARQVFEAYFGYPLTPLPLIGVDTPGD